VGDTRVGIDSLWKLSWSREEIEGFREISLSGRH